MKIGVWFDVVDVWADKNKEAKVPREVKDKRLGPELPDYAPSAVLKRHWRRIAQM
jgi:hypothetical protein